MACDASSATAKPKCRIDGLAQRPISIVSVAQLTVRDGRWASIGQAKFRVGQVVRHRVHPFRGIVFDIDPVFNNTEEWWRSIPAEVRPRKDQPFYHLLAENAQTEYIAYVSEQNLLPDASGDAAAPPAGRRDVHGRRRRQLPAAVPAAAALSPVRPRPSDKQKAARRSGRPLTVHVVGRGLLLAGGGARRAPFCCSSFCFFCSSARSPAAAVRSAASAPGAPRYCCCPPARRHSD